MKNMEKKYKNLTKVPFITKAIPVSRKVSLFTKKQKGSSKHLPSVSQYSKGVKSISNPLGKKYKIKQTTAPQKISNLGAALPSVSTHPPTTGLKKMTLLSGFYFGKGKILKKYYEKRLRSIHEEKEEKRENK